MPTKVMNEGSAPPPAPREVTVSFFINNIKKIDVIEGTVELDFIMYLSWCDPLLRGIPVGDRPPYERDHNRKDEEPCWNPEIEVNNNVNLSTLWAVYPPAYQGVEDGRVIWGARYRGCISNEMDLHSFPIDSDSIHITVGPKNATEDKVVLKVDPKKHRSSPFDDDVDRNGDRIKSSSLTEWTCDVPFVIQGLSGPTGSGSYYSNVEFVVIVHRNFMFYVWKVLVILVFLIVSSWMPLWQDPEDFGARFGASNTLLLAAVAFLFVVNGSLPRISYLTVMDKVLLICFGIIFFVSLESFFVFLLTKYGNDDNDDDNDNSGSDRAKNVDFHVRYLHPLLFLACQARVAWSAVATRARLVGDPAAQWELVLKESALKPMPQVNAEESGDGAGGGGGDGTNAEDSKKRALPLGKGTGGAAASAAESPAAKGTTSRVTEVLNGTTPAAQRQKLNADDKKKGTTVSAL